MKSYHAPRIATPTGKENTGPYRLLGAMVPADDPVWFFKLSGGTDDLTKVEAGFDEHLVKPIDVGRLAALVERATARARRDGSLR